MRELKLYCCEFCGTNYRDKESAKTCEKNHKMPRKYTPTKWKPRSVEASGYPLEIIAEFSNGEKVKYEKRGVIDEY